MILYELLSAVGANPRAAVFSIPVKINRNINAILPHQPCYINIAHLQHVIIDINSRNNTLLKAIAFFRTEPIEKNLKQINPFDYNLALFDYRLGKTKSYSQMWWIKT